MSYRVPDQVPESGAMSGANRGGTNPPTRPVPTRPDLATAGLVFGRCESPIKLKSVTREGI